MVLEFDQELYENSASFEEFLRLLIVRAESNGVLVMRSAIVGYATNRLLNEKEFRGFALPDKIAPIIFINDHDAKAAQIFTFAHELAHIWLGAAGVSDRNPTDKDNSTNAVELHCDRIAAEFLVPASEFAAAWSVTRSIDSNVDHLSREFRVSSLVALRRARDLELITPSEFFPKVTAAYLRYKRHEEQKREEQRNREDQAGNFWASFELRNSATFNSTVVASIKEQRITYAEAGTLFGLAPISAARYVNRVEGLK
jgi:Zn-dependent peptidase ImmA (M78 family)